MLTELFLLGYQPVMDFVVHDYTKNTKRDSGRCYFAVRP